MSKNILKLKAMEQFSKFVKKDIDQLTPKRQKAQLVFIFDALYDFKLVQGQCFLSIPPKKSENQWFSNVSRGYGKGTLT